VVVVVVEFQRDQRSFNIGDLIRNWIIYPRR
jgi:hypothetical protein